MTARDERACMHAWHVTIDPSGASCVVYAMFEIQSCVRGHHVYKDIWTPFVGETLSCEREEDNTADPYAVAVKKKFGRRMPVVVGHVPRRISAACCLFLQRNGIIKCEITGVRRYSAELAQGGGPV